MTIGRDLPTAPDDWFVRPDGSNGAYGIHGRGHARRVWLHCMELAEDLGINGPELEALHLAALWHDIGRTNDAADYYHGAKSAGRVVGMGLHRGVEPPVRDMALFAVTHHSGSEEHAGYALNGMRDSQRVERVFKVLKDADALDRVRLGPYGLDPSFLRFEQSYDRVERAWELLQLIP